MELVDMRDLGSRAVMRWGSSPHARTKTKGNCFRSCLLFWVPAARGGLHPSVISMLGGNEFRLRQGFACGATLVRRKSAAAQKGR